MVNKCINSFYVILGLVNLKYISYVQKIYSLSVFYILP